MSEHDPAVYIEQIIIAARKALAFLDPALLRLLEPLLAKLDAASPPDRPMADGDQ